MFKETGNLDPLKYGIKKNISRFLENLNIKSTKKWWKKTGNTYYEWHKAYGYWYSILKYEKSASYTYKQIAYIICDDDEWYYIYSSTNQVYYKCDQIEGLEECLRSLKIIN